MTQFGKSLVWICVALIAIGCSFVLYPREKPQLPIEPETIQGLPFVNPTPDDTSVISHEIEATSTPYVVTGYYASYVRENIYDGAYYGTSTCDAFIITKNDNSLTEYLLDQIKIGNTVNSITPEGNIRINLDLRNTSPSDKNKITHSSDTNNIQILMTRKKSDAKEAPACYSSVKIIEVK